jgi:hypothetical protein
LVKTFGRNRVRALKGGGNGPGPGSRGSCKLRTESALVLQVHSSVHDVHIYLYAGIPVQTHVTTMPCPQEENLEKDPEDVFRGNVLRVKPEDSWSP